METIKNFCTNYQAYFYCSASYLKDSALTVVSCIWQTIKKIVAVIFHHYSLALICGGLLLVPKVVILSGVIGFICFDEVNELVESVDAIYKRYFFSFEPASDVIDIGGIKPVGLTIHGCSTFLGICAFLLYIPTSYILIGMYSGARTGADVRMFLNSKITSLRDYTITNLIARVFNES